MSSIQSISLPLHGYPSQQLSHARAEAIREGACALDRALFEHPQNVVATREALERFRSCVTDMGLWDRVKDIFINGCRKRAILKALARCHIASYESGRKYLAETGEYPLKTGASSLYLLSKLLPHVRSAMLMPMPTGSPEAPLTLTSSGPPIQLWVPGVDLRLPLMPECFGDGDGALSESEYGWLMHTPYADGKSIHQLLSARRGSEGAADCAWVDAILRP
ncbi:hypothetical protein ACPWR0_11660 [Pandoraea pneumonica]|uniref:hypothetical protein n=1 Tax=Pandoraea pneumonica TaxID=2508299 RepID=UPI003CEBF258